MNWKRSMLIAFVVMATVLFGWVLIGCGPQATPTPCPTAAPCPECPDCPDAPECPECPECAECPEGIEVPFEEAWAGSGHADAEAEAFRHWDEDDPMEVPASCAKCHSAYGYLDFLGEDGSAAGTVDSGHPVDSVVDCVTCHNQAATAMDSVVMPSGIELTGLGDEARCMQCHQGRQSAVSVNARIEEAGVDEDAVSEDLGFANIHYYAAAATKYGTFAKGGYEYEGKTYDANFAHVDGFETCIDCHNSHTLEVKVETCTECHPGMSSAEDFRSVRMVGSLVDYDGDGDVSEGIAFELEGMQELLYAALQAYATEVAGTPVIYDSHSYPYFFIDTNADGVADEDEANYGNRFVSWTPRLLKAAYNYQVSKKDPGAYAHGGKYIMALLYDSIEDLNTALSSPIDLSMAHRIDAGHFAGSEEAFRHWDEDGEVSASCARCHSATGLPTYLKEGVSISEPLANGFQCATCHDFAAGDFAIYEVGAVEFPSGAEIDSGDSSTNLCLNCHQGRTAKASVDGAIAGLDDDTVDEGLRFLNIHYFAAGATLFGSEAAGAYQYDDQEYIGRFAHVAGFDTCASCHDVHGLTLQEEACSGCHTGVEDVRDIRLITEDYDGDGDTDEGIAGEIETMHEALYAAIQAYAADAEIPIVYDSHSYPYFFADTNGDGVATPDEANYGNRFATWTPRLLRAAYNYQYVAKDPGAFAHNGKYVIQVLYDTLIDIGGDTSGMVRP